MSNKNSETSLVPLKVSLKSDVLPIIAKSIALTLSNEEKLSWLLDYWDIYENFDRSLFDPCLLEILETNEPENTCEYQEIFNPIIELGLIQGYSIYNKGYIENLYFELFGVNIMIATDDLKENYTKCPCCAFYTLNKEDNFYAICPVCYWENDGSEPNNYSSMNHSTLINYRKNFLTKNDIEKFKKYFIF